MCLHNLYLCIAQLFQFSFEFGILETHCFQVLVCHWLLIILRLFHFIDLGLFLRCYLLGFAVLNFFSHEFPFVLWSASPTFYALRWASSLFVRPFLTLFNKIIISL